ncbi:hypothetical protein N7474_004111 [Penicillium riverlandense]|uniref:uncharacterized protein n=1 Tax=Penicillium riverlandense TaxID=1903569 RepID=UPI00254747D5|nr:uncharacterized protein N7474_004111 [Penicillium riverlandense]KAJ5818520.1 hypothetical protein N7474_004111 [Penicillium riverlandense]
MFAAHPLPSSPSTPLGHNHYTPVRPSPLGPRSANISTPPWTMGSPSRASAAAQAAGQTQKPLGTDENSHAQHIQSSPVPFPTFTTTPSQQQATSNTNTNIFGAIASAPPLFYQKPTTDTPLSPTSPSPAAAPAPRFAARYASQIANPLRNTSSALVRSKSRKMFLNRVKNDRDAGRFEARGEQIMRMEHLADRRRWEEEMSHDMDFVVGEYEDDAEEDGDEVMIPDEEEMNALDEYLSQEQSVKRAMFESGNGTSAYPTKEPSGSFNDDEYDDIFSAMTEHGYASQDMDMS